MVLNEEGIVEDKNWKTRVWFSLTGKENPMWRMNSNSVPSNLLQGKKTKIGGYLPRACDICN